MEINKKHIIAIDLVLIVGSLLIVAYLAGYSRPLVIGDFNEEGLKQESVLFDINNEDRLVISKDRDFENAREIDMNKDLTLSEGKYFVKIISPFGSEVRELTLLTDVKIDFIKAGNKISVVNKGEKLNVKIFEGDSLKEEVELIGGKNE